MKEIYFIDRANEKIRRLVTAVPVTNTIPDDLADTGCVNPLDPTQPAAGLIPYDINAPFWSDNAAKERFLAIPNGTTIDISADPGRPDDWDFPVGSVLMKNFRLQGRLIETRLLMRHPDGIWGGYTYEWDDAETAATRVIGGKTTPKGPAAQPWIYPSEGQCVACHTGAAGFSLGPETAQLNRDVNYVNGNGVAHQLTTLNHIGMLTMPLPDGAASVGAKLVVKQLDIARINFRDTITRVGVVVVGVVPVRRFAADSQPVAQPFRQTQADAGRILNMRQSLGIQTETATNLGKVML